MRTKYDAKLKDGRSAAITTDGQEEGSNPRAIGGYAAGAKKPATRRPPPERVSKEQPEPAGGSRRGERVVPSKKKMEAAKRLAPGTIGNIETQLAHSDNPNKVAVPVGYQVEVVELCSVACIMPETLGLGIALESSLEILDGITFSALQLHVLQPVISYPSRRERILAAN